MKYMVKLMMLRTFLLKDGYKNMCLKENKCASINEKWFNLRSVCISIVQVPLNLCELWHFWFTTCIVMSRWLCQDALRSDFISAFHPLIGFFIFPKN